MSSRDVTATEGKDVYLICNATGYPEPEISWSVHRVHDRPDQRQGNICTFWLLLFPSLPPFSPLSLSPSLLAPLNPSLLSLRSHSFPSSLSPLPISRPPYIPPSFSLTFPLLRPLSLSPFLSPYLPPSSSPSHPPLPSSFFSSLSPGISTPLLPPRLSHSFTL